MVAPAAHYTPRRSIAATASTSWTHRASSAIQRPCRACPKLRRVPRVAWRWSEGGRSRSSCLSKLFPDNSPNRVRIDRPSGSAEVLPERLIDHRLVASTLGVGPVAERLDHLVVETDRDPCLSRLRHHRAERPVTSRRSPSARPRPRHEPPSWPPCRRTTTRPTARRSPWPSGYWTPVCLRRNSISP